MAEKELREGGKAVRMAPRHYSFLFEDELFRRHLAPLVPELERGEYQRLRAMAYELAQTEPETRVLLDSLYLSHVYDYYDHPNVDALEPSPQYCLVALLKPFMQPLPEGTQFGDNDWLAFGYLRSDLEWLGWSQADTELVLFGKSLCKALNLERIVGSSEQPWADVQDDAPWCHGGLGWLDRDTIETLDQEASRVYRILHEESQNPGASSRLKGQKASIEALLSVFGHLSRVVTAAKKNGKTLLVTVAS
jgi:hypothetical protein